MMILINSSFIDITSLAIFNFDYLLTNIIF
jgi:hypothetical protein